MNRLSVINLAAFICLLGGQLHAAPPQGKEPLKLTKTIPMPNVKGRIDHMDVDVKGRRLFVSGLENDTVQVIDLKEGKQTRSVPGFKTPQGVAFIPSLNKVFVANENDATLKMLRGSTLELLTTVQLDLGANRVTYDARKKRLYVGYGGSSAKKENGEVAIIDAVNNQHIGDIAVGLRPAEVLLDKSGKTLFVFDNVSSKIQFIDVEKKQVVSAWPVSSQRPGDGALDERTHRLLIGTRIPPSLIVMDSTNGREVTTLATVEGMDGVYVDATRKRVYISGGRGFDVGYVFVYQQHDADHYEQIAKIPTRPGAGTSFWSPELNLYFVAAPAHDAEEAGILVFEPQP